MRNLLLIGVVTVVLGIVGLIVQNVSFTETKHVLNVGPLQVTAEEQHNVPIPTIAGLAAVLAGLGMIFASRRYS
jgi:hypothetical protein